MLTKSDHIEIELAQKDATKFESTVLALAAGSIHEAGVRQYTNDFKLAKGDNVKLLEIIFGRLHKANYLSEDEVASFKPILNLLEDRNASTAEVLKLVQSVYNTLVEKRASPLAIAFAGIAKNSVQLVQEKEAEGYTRKKWWAIVGADLAGAGTGALAGALVPGIGLVIGGVCGALTASGTALMETD